MQTEGLSKGCPEHAIRGVRLVRLSTVLAICLEVTPLEMDAISVLWLEGAYRLALLVKVMCITAILLPLVIYAWLNGPRALGYFKGRVAVVAVIVVFHLVFFINSKK
jgi:hypothetical protein